MYARNPNATGQNRSCVHTAAVVAAAVADVVYPFVLRASFRGGLDRRDPSASTLLLPLSCRAFEKHLTGSSLDAYCSPVSSNYMYQAGHQYQDCCKRACIQRRARTA